MYNDFINDELKSKGATLVGFADLSAVSVEARRNLPYGILIAKALNPEIVGKIPSGPHMDYYNEYKSVNVQLNDLCEYTASLIIEKGFNAFPQSKGHIKQDAFWRTPLPHKTVATLAGIGWIGKSAVLVTKEHGCAVRLTTVLTDMPFLTGTPIKASQCGNCMECTTNCPGKAVTGVNWQVGVDRNELLNPDVCKKTVKKRGEPFNLTEGTCGVCIAVCPYTKRYIEKSISYK